LTREEPLENSWLQDITNNCAMNHTSPRKDEIQKAAVATPCTVVERDEYESRPNRTVYMDGVFDLFHIGHIEAIRQCAKLGNYVILGVTGDADAAGYKRPPIICQEERVSVLKFCRFVDKVICPCPMVVDVSFMDKYGIDLVVHGFANAQDAQKQAEFFAVPMQLGKFQVIPYYAGQSTTAIMEKVALHLHQCRDSSVEAPSAAITSRPIDNEKKKIESYSEEGVKATVNPNWFGDSLAAATGNSRNIDYDPFPLSVRNEIERHLVKARKRRKEALNAIVEATGAKVYDAIWSCFESSKIFVEGSFTFDPVAESAIYKDFLTCTGLSSDFDLSKVHEQRDLEHGKDELFYRLTTGRYEIFQESFDTFVRSICVPYLASKFPCDKVYYQAFPCVRIIQPGEFSIGRKWFLSLLLAMLYLILTVCKYSNPTLPHNVPIAHADVAYGHHPCSINFYVPLTPIGETCTLFLESRPGSEDWHPLEGDFGSIKHFAGAVCAHWTPLNKTDRTRVSLDFRIIPDSLFRVLADGGSVRGGQRDVYRQTEGYYSSCRRCANGSSWEREGPLQKPDARTGFPWTVKGEDGWVKLLSTRQK
jgi:cytidyltransferase-like protein